MVNSFDRFPSLANLNEVEEINPLRRAYSDNHVNIASDENAEESTLSVSTNRANVGEKIIVSWKLSQSPSSKDWLGLFYADGKKIFYLDILMLCFYHLFYQYFYSIFVCYCCAMFVSYIMFYQNCK